jgi:hypothetical protein
VQQLPQQQTRGPAPDNTDLCFHLSKLPTGKLAQGFQKKIEVPLHVAKESYVFRLQRAKVVYKQHPLKYAGVAQG